MIQHLLLTIRVRLIYKHSSSYSFPFNQAASPIRHQVFTRREYFFPNDHQNKNSNRNDRTARSILPQVRPLVYIEGCRKSSCNLPTVQKPALVVAEKIQQEKRNRIQSQLIQFRLIYKSTLEGGTLGWIRLHRSIQNNELWKQKPFDEARAWIDMLLRAVFEEELVIVKRGIEIKLKRGQFAASSRELASDWGWHKDGTIRFLKRLKRATMIETQKSNLTSIISIVNYEQYQQKATQNATQNATQTRHRRDTDATHFYIEEGKEGKESRNGSLSEKSREPEAEPLKARAAKPKLVI